ncbi:MAG: M20/M25/M40 family metallo-hydrolase [Methyloligellaceae bacterium]
MTRNRLLSLLGVFLVLVVAPLLAILALTPPAPVPATADKAVFSAERAMRHVEAIAQAPRPVGSAAHIQARRHLIAELTHLGLTPEIQSAPIGPAGGAAERRLYNVMVRLRGAKSSGAVLLMAHYDSVSFGPGASDDGAAVAALLEALRALTAGEPLRNDIIVLFTDAEEALLLAGTKTTLLGAKAFAASHPWMADVALVLNFEARGSSGPAIMFETSRASHALIAELARALPRPVASSLAPTIYDLLPNDTDFTVFKQAGKPGFNFAFIDGYGAYHTKHDTIANLDRRSLQHHGSTALALARHFGGLDLRGLGEGAEAGAVYFDLLGRVLVHYPVAWAQGFAVATLLAFVGVFVVGLRRGRLGLRGVVLGTVYVIGSTLLLAVAVWLMLRGLAAVWGPPIFQSLLTTGPSPKEIWVVMGLWTLTAAVFISVTAWKPWRLKVADLAAAAVFVLILTLVAIGFLLPGASYLLQWPAAFALASLIWTAGGILWLVLPAVPVVLIAAPALYLMFLALLGMGPPIAILIIIAASWVYLLGLLSFLNAAARPERALVLNENPGTSE